jgi:hypothetical protein
MAKYMRITQDTLRVLMGAKSGKCNFPAGICSGRSANGNSSYYIDTYAFISWVNPKFKEE